MLLHLEGIPQNDVINFNPPDIDFSLKQSVQVKQILIQWSEPVENVFGSLCTSLIDCSVSNPDQRLCYFNQTIKSNHLLFTPPGGLWYKIQLWSLKQTIFKLQLSEKHQIEKIKLILEISNGF